MQILNLYACLGGNRYLWDELDKNIQVTAVELDPNLAELYADRFPKDNVIIEDAHKYLLDNYKKFDFIWSSPPCPSHSRARFTQKERYTSLYPDLKLYEEIIFSKHYFKGKFCVENVIPYYEPLIAGQKRGRHLYWTNFLLPQILSNRETIKMECANEEQMWCEFHKINLKNYKGNQRTDKIARNLVDYEAGKTILQTALKIYKNKDTKQLKLL